MGHAFVSLFLLVAFAGVLSAQRSNGYVFFAPGGVTCCGYTDMSLQVGVGGEVGIAKGIGAGLEVAAIGPRQDFIDNAMGTFSPNGYYHFIHGKESRLDPFVTAGYTLLFRTGHANLFNFGGGTNYWFRNHLGVRLEFRDHVWSESGGTLHFWGFRFGFAF